MSDLGPQTRTVAMRSEALDIEGAAGRRGEGSPTAATIEAPLVLTTEKGLKEDGSGGGIEDEDEDGIAEGDEEARKEANSKGNGANAADTTAL